MEDLTRLSAVSAANEIRARRLRSEDLVGACLARIASREPSIGAWEYIDAEGALAAARQADRSEIKGPLHGVPIGVKDVIDTSDMPTELGTPVYRGRRPDWDAACVALVRAAGAIVIGKTTTTELAFVHHSGRTANPSGADRSPGASSIGSAAAVADYMVPIAFGTQTASSIIRPASYCGVVGYKASAGEFSLAGVKPFAPSLDSLGWLTRDVADGILLWRALMGAGADEAARQPTPARLGVCRLSLESADDDAQRVMQKAVHDLEAVGATLEETVLPHGFSELPGLHRVVMSYEAARSYVFERLRFGSRLSDSLLGLLEDGLAISRETYSAALRSIDACRGRVRDVFKSTDAILTLSAAGEAPLGRTTIGDPIFSRPWSALQLPSVSLPGYSGRHGLPIGIQLVGTHGSDRELLETARWVMERLFPRGE